MKQLGSKIDTRIHHLFKVLLLTGMAALLAVPAAWAVGTPSGTAITNRATINYSVGTVPQTLIESSPTGNAVPGVNNGANTSFVVDNRVNVVVASLGNASVIPGQADRVLAFSVTNTGNTTQGYAVEAVAGVTAIPMTTVRLYRDVNNNGLLDAGDTLYTAGTNIGNLNPNGTIGTDDVMRVLIVANTPAVAADGGTDTYWLRAITLNAGTTTVTAQTNVGGADNPNQVDVIFGDADDGNGGAVDGLRNGQHAARGVYTLGTAALAVQKRSAVVQDPILGVSPNAKAIPGAIVLYTIQIQNSGSQIAEAVTISDTLNTNATYVANSVQINGTGYADGSAAVTFTAPNQLLINAGTIAAGGTTSTVTFRATIN
jgi:uncharacterized repeat protein (TIGR01451 family)